MLGIALLDFARVRPITLEDRDALIEIVYDVLGRYGRRPDESFFVRKPADELDTSGYSYVLIIDSEHAPQLERRKERIRKEIRRQVAQVWGIDQNEIAVWYRLIHASFG